MRALIILLGLLGMACLWSATQGAYAISIRDLWAWWQGEASETLTQVMLHIRLPRLVMAVVVGAVLASCGAAYQGMFKNPLVSPDILGVSAGAGLGACVGILCHVSFAGIQLAAFLGGLVAVLVVMGVGMQARFHDRTLVLVLAGMAVGSLLGAGISLTKLLADPYTELPSITFWLLGSLSGVGIAEMRWSLGVMLLGFIPLYMMRWRLNVLSLSDDEAKALGVPVERTRWVFILSATLATASAVSVTGIIGWVGLVIPHMVRFWVGANYVVLLPASALAGSLFLVLTDTMARTLMPIEIPLGLLTSLLGAPFFLFLLMRKVRV